jgi:hypothetical protein
MREVAFTILGALLIAGSAVQMATASERHVRTGRVHHQWDRAHNQLTERGFSIPQMPDGYGQGGGLSKPAASEVRSCDRVWCYPD